MQKCEIQTGIVLWGSLRAHINQHLGIKWKAGWDGVKLFENRIQINKNFYLKSNLLVGFKGEIGSKRVFLLKTDLKRLFVFFPPPNLLQQWFTTEGFTIKQLDHTSAIPLRKVSGQTEFLSADRSRTVFGEYPGWWRRKKNTAGEDGWLTAAQHSLIPDNIFNWQLNDQEINFSSDCLFVFIASFSFSFLSSATFMLWKTRFPILLRLPACVLGLVA